MLFGRGQNPPEMDHEKIADQVGVMSLGPRPMYSCSKQLIPSQTAASISPWVLMVTSDGRPSFQSEARPER